LLGGRYRLTGQIGAAGAIGTHRAIDLRLNRPVSVALFPPGGDQTTDLQFEGEAQGLANLGHSGLIAVYDFGVERNCSFLVTELAEGPTLRELLDSERLPSAEVARIGADIANVLSYLHDHGVVHGRLSPANVVLDPTRGVRLAGHGFVPLLETAGFTALDAAPDNGAYLAPEQEHERRPGAAADVYALGLVLLEAVTARAHSPAIPRGLAEPLRTALTDMTEAAPASRPTARQVEAMLMPADRGGPVEPADGPDHVREQPRGSATRLALGVGLVVLLAVLVGAALMNWRDDREPPTAPSTPPTTAQDSEDEPGISLPSIPTIPNFEAPDLPELPDIPTEVPEVPQVPDSVSEDARSLWTQFTDWLSRTF
jgi:serine/threonine protein kinase